MYIQKAEIKNVRSIVDFEIEFKNPAGWHVLIGDNGSGKSTIVRSIALGLVGNQSQSLRENWKEWMRKDAIHSPITLNLFRDKQFDSVEINGYQKSAINNIDDSRVNVNIIITTERKKYSVDRREATSTEPLSEVYFYGDQTSPDKKEENHKWLIHKMGGFFSVAYGPYRRFEGGNSEWDEVYNNSSLANLAAHLSVFNESVALTEPINWLKDLNYKNLEKDKESQKTLENIRKLINSRDFLPHNSKLESIGSDGVFFKDGNGTIISVNQMSDGYRSILSMTFELIRQLVRVYGSELVFKNIEKGKTFINLPGVVLIDEIDAHLHPTWQTRIGNWFLKYFPKLQFIVTTHSPLVCRAAENGSIWRLAAPGSDERSGEITGLDRERLIYGNILDAYGTGTFGENTSISEDSNEMLNRLSKLNVKSMMGLINNKENKELEELRAKFPTENAIKK